MKYLIFIPPNDFRDESLSLVKLFFDKWGVRYDISSYSRKECIGTHGAAVMPDLHTSEVNMHIYDGIVLIDGKGIDSYKLTEYRPLLDMLFLFNENKKKIISINNAVKLPAKANIIRGRKIAADSSDPETKRFVILFHGELSDNKYELADNLVTIKDSKDLEDSMPQVLEHIGVI